MAGRAQAQAAAATACDLARSAASTRRAAGAAPEQRYLGRFVGFSGRVRGEAAQELPGRPARGAPAATDRARLHAFPPGDTAVVLQPAKAPEPAGRNFGWRRG